MAFSAHALDASSGLVSEQMQPCRFRPSAFFFLLTTYSLAPTTEQVVQRANEIGRAHYPDRDAENLICRAFYG